MPVTVTSFPMLDPLKNLTFLPMQSLLMSFVVVILPVVPPFAVIVLDQSIHHPHDHAPNAPARAMFGICENQSSSVKYKYWTVAESTSNAVFLIPCGSFIVKAHAPVLAGNGVIICHSFLCNSLLFLLVIAIVWRVKI